MDIPTIQTNDVLYLKKKHPCGSNSFLVLRVGTDIRIECQGCKKDMTLPRIKIEKIMKR